MNRDDALLQDWRTRALALETEVKKAVIGQDHVIHHINIAVFARGHVLLEGDVGVGKTIVLRAARVKAWLDNREFLTPEDLQAVYHETMAHRVFFNPIYEMRRGEVSRALMEQILQKISAP